MSLNQHFLFASLIWGYIGMGYCSDGRKQQAMPAFVAGVLMIAASYFINSALLMSLVCLGLAVGEVNARAGGKKLFLTNGLLIASAKSRDHA